MPQFVVALRQLAAYPTSKLLSVSLGQAAHMGSRQNPRPAQKLKHLLCPAAQARQHGSNTLVLQRLQGVRVALLCSCNLVVQQLGSRGLPCSALLPYNRC